MGYQGRSKAKGQRGGAFVGWFCSYHQGGLSLIAGRRYCGGGVEAAMAANAKVEELLLIAVVLREKGEQR